MNVRECHGKTLKYLVIEPDGHDSKKRYPMVILMHGLGANMADLAGLCPEINPSGYIYICPNAPIPLQITPEVIGYAWTPPRGAGTSEDVLVGEKTLAKFVDEVTQAYNPEPGQVILGGFSQGGMMAYRCGLTSPHVFRGLAALSSMIPDPDLLLSRLPTTRGQHIFVAHGTSDRIISVADARESVRFLRDEGYKPDYKEYPMGHEIRQEVIDDLGLWIRMVLPPLS